jgi:hypothetical protein
LVGVLAVISAGCISQDVTKNSGEAVLLKTVTPTANLTSSLVAFRVVNSRWPQNAAELSAFITTSDGRLEPLAFDQLDLEEKPDGTLQIYAAAAGITNRLSLTYDEIGQE